MNLKIMQELVAYCRKTPAFFLTVFYFVPSAMASSFLFLKYKHKSTDTITKLSMYNANT